MSESWPRRSWPHVRAFLLLLHLSGVLLMALPSSQRLGDRKHWQAPKQQKELRGWADRLGLDKDAFQSFLWDTSQHYLNARKKIVGPFLKYADYVGTRQGWTMFANPRRQSGRLEVFVQIQGEWQLVYKPNSSEYDWNRWQFEHNRVRKLMGRLVTNPQLGVYIELTRWVARRLARDFPSATRAKIRLIVWPSQGPAQVRAGEERQEGLARNQEFDLGGLR